MDASFLEQVTIQLPGGHKPVSNLLSLVEKLGKSCGKVVEFSRSKPEFLPHICLQSDDSLSIPRAAFSFSDGASLEIPIENTTGLEKQSPHQYGYVSLEETARRLASAGLALSGIDHAGFNQPWFGPGVHPQITILRERLSNACLYHRFPTGEAWDFIIPGSLEEVRGAAIDYSIPRTPKFELVSFEKCSRPLVQLDVSTPASYETLAALFPESLKDPGIGNIWVYLENGLTIDLCLVLNPVSEKDWSTYFKGYRL